MLQDCLLLVISAPCVKGFSDLRVKYTNAHCYTALIEVVHRLASVFG